MKGVGGGADFRNHAAWARPAKIAADTTTSAIRQPCRQLRTRAARGAMTDGAQAAKFRPRAMKTFSKGNLLNLWNDVVWWAVTNFRGTSAPFRKAVF